METALGPAAVINRASIVRRPPDRVAGSECSGPNGIPKEDGNLFTR